MWRSLLGLKVRHGPPSAINGIPLFGSEGERLFGLLESFSKAAGRRSYRILPLGHFEALLQKSDLSEANKVYWEEILSRAHFSASTGLLRTCEWVRGARHAVVNENVLVLAATLRGLLEATADTYQAFEHIPLTLAACHTVVRRALAGSMREVWASVPELETLLHHFAYARRIESEGEPRLVEAKSVKEYIDALVPVVPDVAEIYGILCQYTHPSAESVFRFGEEKVEPDHMTLAFDPNVTADRLLGMVRLSQEMGRLIVYGNIMPCVMTLQVLNRLGAPGVFTQWAETVSWGKPVKWAAIEERLRDSSPPTAERITERTLDELRKLAAPARNRQRSRTVPPTRH